MTQAIKNLSPAEVSDALGAGSIHLIDVREQTEFDQVSIEGSLNHPLSSFNPTALPDDNKPIVFMCAAGVRSLHAIEFARAAGRDVHTHMGAGIRGWLMSGLPVAGK